MQRITPFLWFDNNAEEAMNFYLSVFKDGKAISASPMSVVFELNGQRFYGLNGVPHFKFTEAVSFFVDCEDQAEVDMLWEKLSEGGEKSRCGWLKDKFGLSWQIIPTVLGELLNDPDEGRSSRAMEAMMKMDKIIIADLENAANNI
jgi:predicted 3-demethylubiquinone-9 3-methyltransferase (glyoxalase superfamily)